MTFGRPAFWKRGKGEGEHKFSAKACWVNDRLELFEEKKVAPEVIDKLKRDRKGDPESAIRFPSKREAKRWIELYTLARAGQIRDLRRQVTFHLQTRNVHGLMENVTAYRADFVYFDVNRNIEVVEDSKGFPTPEFELKRKWFAVQYGRQIEEV